MNNEPQPVPLMFYRLIYTSHAIQPLDLATLLERSQQSNPALGITGGLVVLDGVFLQYLEGSRDAVDALFERILADPLHRDVKVLEKRDVPRRMFANWSMALLEWTETTKAIYRSFSPGHRLHLYDTDPTTAAPLFRAWAGTPDWRQGVSMRTAALPPNV